MFLGISNYTHKPTARKCILTNKLFTSNEDLILLFDELKVSKYEIENIVNTKYWDMKNNTITEYVINL